MWIKDNKIFNYALVLFLLFLFSNNICYNLISIIENKFVLKWSFNFFNSISSVLNYRFLFGNALLLIIMFLIIAKYDRTIRLKFARKKGLPQGDGNFEHGSSRWLTKKEIKKNFKVWEINKPLISGGVPVTSIGGKVYYDDSTDHSLVIGSTGSGKTRSFIMPLIFNLADAGESMVINDTKGELYSTTYDYLKNKGYEIRVINLRDAFASDGWNPLHLPYKYYKEGNIDEAGDLIENFAKSLTKNLSSKDMYWEKSATSVLSALCYAIIEDAPRESQVNLYSIYNLLVEHGAKDINRRNSLDLYFQEKPFGNLAKNSYATGSFAKGETRATLFSVLATVIKMFSDTGIANLTSHTDFELSDIGKKKTAVFLIIPDEKQSRHELACLFIDQCYMALINSAQLMSNGMMPVRVNFILDEFANMPPISNISNKITVSRSRNIRFYLVLQDFDQLKEKYKEASGTIKSNCTNWVYLLTSDNETAKEISARLGKYTISSDRVSTSSRLEQIDFNISNDKSLMGRELLMPDELMRFGFGESIFIKTRMHPIKAVILPIEAYDFNIKYSDVPKLSKERTIDIFDLDKYRERVKQERIELLADIV
jgi:Type IV secretory pathway, VirD4 components